MILEIWALGAEEVSGSWFKERGIDPSILTAGGFLEPTGWEEIDLIDEGDEIGGADLRVIIDNDRAFVARVSGQETLDGNPERYRRFRVNADWLIEYLASCISPDLDQPFVEQVGSDLIALGRLRVELSDVPVYLARRLDDEKILAETDLMMRARGDQGLGLVLHAGSISFRCIAANVLTPIAGHLDKITNQSGLTTASLRQAFRSNRHLARGGQSIELLWDGGETGELSIPGKATVQILGSKRLTVVDRLVKAYKRGMPAVKTSALNHDLNGIAIRNVFGAKLWARLEGVYIRSAGHGLWEIAF